MPLDVPVLAPVGGRDRLGLHPDHDDRGLGLLRLSSSVPSYSARRRRSLEPGLGVDELADLDVLGLDRGAGDVVDDADALASRRVWSQLVAGQRAEVAQQRRSAGSAEQRQRAEQACCGSACAGAMPDSLDAAVERRRRRSSRSSSVERGRVPQLDDLVVAHQLAWPTGSRRRRCSSSASPRVMPEGEVRGADSPRIDVGIVARRRRRSRRRTNPIAQIGARPNSVATWRSARFAALGRRRWAAAGAPAARGRRSGSSAPRSSQSSRRRRRSVPSARGRCAALLSLARLRPIQTATPISAPRPTIQANRPSVTGPRPPSARPPWLGCVMQRLEVGDDRPACPRA